MPAVIRFIVIFNKDVLMTNRFADFIAGFFAVLFCAVWLAGCQTVVSPTADAVAVLPEYTFVPDGLPRFY